MIKTLSLVFFILLTGFSQAIYADPITEAKTLFNRYASIEAAFDPNVVELYADDAIVRNKRIYPTGQVRELTIPAPQYKQLIRAAMPLAQIKNDYNTYSEVMFKGEGRGVRITAKRFSVMKKYSSPVSLWVAPDATGRWLIHEELTESRPF